VFEGAAEVNEYVGGYSDWLRQRRESAAPTRRAGGGRASTPRAATPAGAMPPVGPKPRKLSYKDQRELDGLPALIQALESDQARLSALIADPALFQRNPVDAANAVKQLASVQSKLETAFARWEALESRGKA
jgi:ATP-binding cassette subfamily F protein uup